MTAPNEAGYRKVKPPSSPIRRYGGIALIAFALLFLIFGAIGTRVCGPLEVGTSEDVAKQRLRAGDTIPSIRQDGGSWYEYRCVSGIGANWPFLLAGLACAGGAVVILLRSRKRGAP